MNEKDPVFEDELVTLWELWLENNLEGIFDTEDAAIASLEGRTAYLNEGTADIKAKVYDISQDDDLRDLYDYYAGSNSDVREAVDVWGYYEFKI